MKTFEFYRNGTVHGEIKAANLREAKKEIFATFGRELQVEEKETSNVYGVLLNGVHVDVSRTERGAKNFATRNGYNVITIRFNAGYIAREIAVKRQGKWIELKQVQTRYNS